MAKLTKRAFLNITPSQIGKLKKADLRALLRGARQLWNAQSSTFEKYGEKVYSHSYEKMRDYYTDHGREVMKKRGGIEFYSTEPEVLSKMNMNQMRAEVFRLQEFFDSKTSTVPGAKKVTADMARRIFGSTKSGRPKHNLSVDEWREYWEIYEEYKNQRPSDVFDQSNLVQQMLGQMAIGEIKDFGQMPNFGQAVLDELRDLVEARRTRLNAEMDVDYGDSRVSSIKRPY